MPARLEWAIAVALLALLALLSVGASRHRGPAFDELAHLVAGASYVEHGDYRLHPENGLLPQTLFGLALRGEGIEPPPADGEVWRTSDMWTSGRAFLFGQDAQWQHMLLRARSVAVLLSLLLAVSVWRVARRMWGPSGGLTALTLYSLSPEVLAHSATATSDLCAALFFFWSTWALWELLGTPNRKTVLLTSAALVGLALSKASAVLMAPVGVVMLGVRWRRSELPRRAVLVASLGAVLALLVLGTWAGYGFRYSTFAPGDPTSPEAEFAKPWEPMLARTGVLQGPISFARDHELLPEAWLYGFTFVLAHSQARPAFLRGEHRSDGWWWFFPYVFLMKTPLSVLIVLTLAALVGLRSWSVRSVSCPALLFGFSSFLLVYWLVSLTSHLNIGSRHLLPTLPAMFVLAGAVGPRLAHGRGRIVGAALLAALVMDLGVAYPRYMAYFNPLDGGPRQAWRRVVDSSVDWGQDGPELARQLEALVAPGEPVYLAWFGSADPREFGIQADSLPSFMAWRAGPPRPLLPGVYAISATQLQGVYLPEPGPWTEAHEQRYRQGQRAYRDWVASGSAPELAAAWVKSVGGEAAAQRALDAYGVVRFQRLSAWLRVRGEPVARAGWSVLIFRLTEQDLADALGGPPPG